MRLSTIITRVFALVVLQLVFAGVSATAQYEGGIWLPAAGPYGGTITALIAASDGSMIAGTPAGIYRSTNAGEEWYQMAGVMPTVPVNDLARDSSGVLYAATAYGVYRSANDGQFWSSIGLENTYVRSVTIFSSNDVYVGSTGTIFKLVLSTWQPYRYDNIDRNTPISVLASKRGIIYAGTQGEGLFNSDDDGKTMQPVEGMACNDVLSIDMREIDSANGGYGLAIGTSCGLYRWSTLQPDMVRFDGPLTDRPVGAVKLINNVLFAGTLGNGIWRTFDGINWTEVYNGMENPTIHSIEGLPNGTIFCGTLHGLQRTTNQGERWDAVSRGILATSIRSVIVNPKGYLFACTVTGVYRSMDRGASWQEKNYLLHDRNVQCFALDPDGKLWAGTRHGRLFASADDGDSWEEKTFVSTNPIESILWDTFERLFVGTSGDGGLLYISLNQGGSWSMIINGEVKALARGGNTIYNLTSDKGLYTSSDNGETWNNRLKSKEHISLAVNANSKVFMGGENITRISYNGGLNWIAGSPLQCTSVRAVMMDAAGNLIAGTGCGVFRSLNNGEKWISDRTGLASRQINSLARYSDGMMVAGTDGAGIYLRENTSPTNSVDISTNDASALTIDAGTAAHTGVITFTVDRPGRYTVTLYDPLGQELEIVADTQFDIGRHRLEGSFDGLASGVYLLQVRGGGSVATAKLVIER